MTTNIYLDEVAGVILVYYCRNCGSADNGGQWYVAGLFASAGMRCHPCQVKVFPLLCEMCGNINCREERCRANRERVAAEQAEMQARLAQPGSRMVELPPNSDAHNDLIDRVEGEESKERDDE